MLQVSHSARCGEMYAGKPITTLGIEKKIKPCTDGGEIIPPAKNNFVKERIEQEGTVPRRGKEHLRHKK